MSHAQHVRTLDSSRSKWLIHVATLTNITDRKHYTIVMSYRRQGSQEVQSILRWSVVCLGQLQPRWPLKNHLQFMWQCKLLQ